MEAFVINLFIFCWYEINVVVFNGITAPENSLDVENEDSLKAEHGGIFECWLRH